jgi:hypothetical protein
VAADAALPASTPPPEAVRSPYLTLIGAHTAPVAAGAAGEAVFTWQVDQPPPYPDLTPLLQLEDANGAVLSRADMYVTETDRWRAGETLLHRMPVRVPVGTPPGRYPLRLAWVGRAADTYVPYRKPDESQAGIWATVGFLDVVRPSAFPDPAALTMATRRDLDAAPGVRLLGWDAPPAARRPGEALPISLYWQAAEDAPISPSVRAVLRGAAGEIVLWAGAAGGDYTSDRWVRDELIHERAVWRLPRSLAGGAYTLLLNAGGVEVELGQVNVEGVARLFEPPAVDQVVNVRFGEMIALYGYRLLKAEDGTTIELVWQSLTDQIPRNYTVFVHLVDFNNQIVAQRDSMPLLGEYPTTLWAADEYVVDRYPFEEFREGEKLYIGLYWAEDGTRLTIDRNGLDYYTIRK